ncbi:capsular polysaccharide synthesis enzyme Cap5F [Escherichia coli DEC10A]|nr:capsular polysaccharide synthesis enzyme Cap5F [Escherichia coli DEC10A]
MLSSSIQAECDNAYGKSKAVAEKIIQQYGETTNAKYYIYRLPNVFGKWCQPNYNSFIATFCHRIANDEAITINDPSAVVNLVYIDDFCSDILKLLEGANETGYRTFGPIYSVTVGEVAQLIYRFKESRQTLIIEDVGNGFTRALYSTWLSYLSPKQFAYTVPSYSDDRGVFCEVLKTKNAGQFSFFTAHPGITRGGIIIIPKMRNLLSSEEVLVSNLKILSRVNDMNLMFHQMILKLLKQFRDGRMTLLIMARMS